MSRLGQEAKGLGQDIGDHSMRVAAIIRGETPEKEGAEASQMIEQRYCYRTQADILCYREPLPGQERRLVGSQAGRRAASKAVMQPEVITRAPVRSVPLAPPATVAVPTATTPFMDPKKPVSLMSAM